jgi:hypothetical protein
MKRRNSDQEIMKQNKYRIIEINPTDGKYIKIFSDGEIRYYSNNHHTTPDDVPEEIK